MARRLNVLLSCLVGCVVGAVLGLLLLLKFGSVFPAMLCAAVFPVIGCSYAGVGQRQQLAKIAMLAGVGWMLTYLLQPTIAQSADLRVQRVATQTLVGYQWHLPASAVSSLLAMVGAGFAPLRCQRLAEGDFDDA